LYEQGNDASRQALLKYMMKNFNLGKDEKAVNTHLKLAFFNASGLEKGLLVQSTGKGATGSVKLSKNAVTAGPSKAATAKKPKAATAVKKAKATTTKAANTKKTLKPKKVSLRTAKAKNVAPKKTAAAKPKATKVNVKPKITKAAAGKAKKPASKK